MKKIILSFIVSMFSLVMYSQTYDVTISGIVTNEATGEAVPMQEMIIITDSSFGGFMYYNTVFTDDYGYYNDVMQIPIGVEGFVEITTIACNNMLSQSGQFSDLASALTFDFQICNDSIGNDCQAMYYYYPGDTPLSIQFTDDSWGFPSYWAWNFGDGETSSQQNPLHTFPNLGEYTTSLTITSQDSTCNSTIDMVIWVMEDSITYDVTISGIVTNEITGEVVPMQEMIIIIDSSFGSFMYYNTVFTDDYGYYNDIMQVPTGVEGNVDITTQSCNNMITQTGYFSDTASALTIDFQICGDSTGNECEAMYYYISDNTPLNIQFMDISWGFPTYWAWDFGDGETSSQQNPLHTFPNFGEYTTSLTITNQDSTCNSTIDMVIRVIEDSITPGGCQAMFISYHDSINMQSINYIDMSYVNSQNGIADSWYWDFGDGNSSSDQNPIHTYAVDGEYIVCLTITSLDSNINCESTDCQLIYVGVLGNNCVTWFDYEINDLSVDFQAYLEGGYDAEYTWEFGDGAIGTGTTITHTYAESGMYEVMITAINNDSMGSCTSTYSDIVWIGEDISFNIYGYVYLEDSMMADFANVYLITYDTLGTGLLNVGTTQIDSYGYYEFEEVALQNCIYYVQAELTDQSANFDNFIPTYHFDAVNWEQAWPIFPYTTGWNYDIYMQNTSGSNPGNGVITGTVSKEGSKKLLSNVEVLLLDQQGNAISHTKTNADGVFTFENIALDTYVIYTEIVGIETIPFDVTLDEQNNSTTVSVIVKNGQALLGIDDIASAYITSVEDIFPNPVTANASLNILIKESSSIKVEVLDQYGQSLYKTKVSLSTGKHKVIIPSTSFAHGMYFVKITANDNISSVRKFIKLK